MGRELIVRVTDHAYEQYCKRVEHIGRAELRNVLQHDIADGDYLRKGDYLHVDGVWWVCEVEGGVMILITCYGRSDFDLPGAMRWARLHRDRIRLDADESPEGLTFGRGSG